MTNWEKCFQEETRLSLDPLFQKMVSSISSLPGIGKKSATRIAFHLLRMEESQFARLLESVRIAKEQLGFCKICGSLTEHEVCDICLNDSRSTEFICVVEQPEDVFSIEATGEFKGKYHVLGGVLSPIDGIGPEKLKIKELINRVRNDEVKEILLATNPTLEGDATASYITDALEGEKISISRIAYGIAVGAQIEYADQYTLGKAIKGRRLV